MKCYPSRRHFLASGVLLSTPGAVPCQALAADKRVAAKVERLGVGAIGLRYQGGVIANKAARFGDIVAVCDVDKNIRDTAKAAFGSTPRDFEDYQDLLARPEVDVVTIGTPDHWHTKMIVDACRAGKDVYCEKPLTLTIDEGKLLRKVVAETGRIVQVGSWQRSDQRFRQAVEMVRQGHVGKLQRVDIVLGKNIVGGPFQPRVPPTNLNWDLWQGQTPNVAYREQRSHYTFRWWYEYSGGQMTDWGAHHVDIGQWAINSHPVEIKTTSTFPPGLAGINAKPTDRYNVPQDFTAEIRYANGVVMTVNDTGRNGIMFTGDQGRLFVNRGAISGKPVEELGGKRLDRRDLRVYDFDNLDRPERAGKLEAIINHMGNFFDCVQARRQPISDVESQHRSVSTCHLANISIRLNRKLKWDPVNETFPGDPEANQWLAREQRKGFETA